MPAPVIVEQLAPAPVLFWMTRPFHDLIALAERARRGDRDALERLLHGSLGIVHSMARARLGNTVAAEGAVVDVLARVALGIGSLRDAQAYPRWLPTWYAVTLHSRIGKRGSTVPYSWPL